MKRMNPRRVHALLRGLAFLATLASSGIGIMFITMAGGMPPLLRILFLIPILSAPVLVGLLVWQAVRPGNKTQANRVALREAAPAPRDGLVEEDRTIVMIKQKRFRRY